jgi:hypothetical protein
MTTFILIIVLFYPAIYCFCAVAFLLARRSVGPIVRDDTFRPAVTIIIASAGEGVKTIREKIDNTLALSYRPELLEIILFSDGKPISASIEPDVYERVRFIQFEQLGKTECQNRCVALASGEIILFTDVTSMLEPDSLSLIVRWYADPRVGSVGGSFAYRFMHANVEAGYVTREIKNKLMHSRYGIVTGYFGPLYSVRKSAYPPMPAFYSADYTLPIEVSWNGLLSIMEPEARSYRTLERRMEQELARKRRIIAQGIAATLHILRGKGMGLIKRIDLFAAVLINKLLRWFLIPYGLVLYLAMLYMPAAFITVSFVGICCLAGSLVYRRGNGQNYVLLAPYYAAVISVATLFAIFDVLRGETYTAWNPGSR